jgi:hypothetical protein
MVQAIHYGLHVSMVRDSKIGTVPVFKTDKNQLINRRNPSKTDFTTVISFGFYQKPNQTSFIENHENRTGLVGFENPDHGLQDKAQGFLVVDPFLTRTQALKCLSQKVLTEYNNMQIIKPKRSSWIVRSRVGTCLSWLSGLDTLCLTASREWHKWIPSNLRPYTP